MRTKAYGEELTTETLENVTGGDFVSRPQTLPERLGWNRWWCPFIGSYASVSTDNIKPVIFFLI